jgi:hypothetical protein
LIYFCIDERIEMKKYLIHISVILFFSCSNNTGGEQTESKQESENNLKETSKKYRLIKDNLYSDGKGALYLKSRTREHFETGKWIDVWIKTVYCDTCGTLTEDGWKDITELKDFVDTNTWQYDTSNGYWTEYIDKNYRYHHTHMADGGAISLESK